jgi:hypothetical protein
MALLRLTCVQLSLLFVIAMPHPTLSGWKERLREDAPKDWAALKEMGSHLRCTYTIDTTFTGVKRPAIQQRCVAAIDGEKVKVETKLNDKEQVDCTNSDYMFSISRKSGASSFALDYVEPKGGHDNLFHNSIEKMKMAVFDDVNSSWYMNGRSLDEWFGKPGFRVVGADQVSRAGEILVEVRFDYTDPGTDRKQDIANGRLLLDPNRKWTIREFQVEMWWGTVKTTITYDGDSDGFPRVLEKKTISLGNDKTTMTTDVRFGGLERGQVPESDFRMTAFGLPEPRFSTSLAGMTALWFLFTAVLLAFAAHLVRRRLSQANPALRA